MLSPCSDKDEPRATQHGDGDSVLDEGCLAAWERIESKPEQDDCDAPPKDRKDMPACPQNAHMALAKQRAAFRWHNPTFT